MCDVRTVGPALLAVVAGGCLLKSNPEFDGAAPCEDEFEDNDVEDAAVFMGVVPQGSRCGHEGSLGGRDTEDWFRFEIVPDSMSMDTVQPTADLSVPGLSCLFVECSVGETLVNCPANRPTETSPSGRQGCCDSGEVVTLYNCTTPARRASVYVQVSSDAATCDEYDLALMYGGFTMAGCE